MNTLPVAEVTEQVIKKMTETKNNQEFLDKIDLFVHTFR